MSNNNNELKFVLSIATGAYSTHKKEIISADYWLRSVEASKKSKQIKQIIKKQKERFPVPFLT